MCVTIFMADLAEMELHVHIRPLDSFSRLCCYVFQHKELDNKLER